MGKGERGERGGEGERWVMVTGLCLLVSVCVCLGLFVSVWVCMGLTFAYLSPEKEQED